MARGNRPIEIRVDDATRDRWTAAAKDDGSSLSSFVKECVEARLGGVRPAKSKPTSAADRRRDTHRPVDPARDLDRREVTPRFK